MLCAWQYWCKVPVRAGQTGTDLEAVISFFIGAIQQNKRHKTELNSGGWVTKLRHYDRTNIDWSWFEIKKIMKKVWRF